MDTLPPMATAILGRLPTPKGSSSASARISPRASPASSAATASMHHGMLNQAQPSAVTGGSEKYLGANDMDASQGLADVQNAIMNFQRKPKGRQSSSKRKSSAQRFSTLRGRPLDTAAASTSTSLYDLMRLWVRGQPAAKPKQEANCLLSVGSAVATQVAEEHFALAEDCKRLSGKSSYSCSSKIEENAGASSLDVRQDFAEFVQHSKKLRKQWCEICTRSSGKILKTLMAGNTQLIPFVQPLGAQSGTVSPACSSSPHLSASNELQDESHNDNKVINEGKSAAIPKSGQMCSEETTAKSGNEPDISKKLATPAGDCFDKTSGLTTEQQLSHAGQMRQRVDEETDCEEELGMELDEDTRLPDSAMPPVAATSS